MIIDEASSRGIPTYRNNETEAENFGSLRYKQNKNIVYNPYEDNSMGRQMLSMAERRASLKKQMTQKLVVSQPNEILFEDTEIDT